MDTMILAPVVVATLIGLFVVGDLLIFKIGVKLFRREESSSKLAQYGTK